MSTLTKAQLVVELASLREHLARREAEYETAQQRIAQLEAQRPQRKPAYTPRPPSPEQLAIRAAMAKAKAVAMATGHTVRVDA